LLNVATNVFQNLNEKIDQLGISPVFFIGSGLSRRYFDAPDWEGLLRQIRTDWDRKFDYYLQACTENGEYRLEKLAELLSEMYFEKLEDEDLEPNKNKDYYFKKRIVQILNDYLGQHLDEFQSNHEIQSLCKTSPSAIITTNYDDFLERMFPEFDVLVGQQSLLSTNIGAVGEIYKIHGCVSDPNSIVITQTDYRNFEDKEIYLNAKLLTLFLEYPIIFLGYSLIDKNVKSILTSIIKMLPEDKVNELSKRIWFIKRNESHSEDYSKVERINLGNGLFIDVETLYLNDYSTLYNLLSSSKIQKLPIKFLKFLKSNVYTLAASQEYNPKLLDVNIADIEKVEDYSKVNNFIGLTFSTKNKGAKDILTKKDIIEPILQQEDCPYKEAAIKFMVQNYTMKLPIHYFISRYTQSELFTIMDEMEEFSDVAKTAIKQRYAQRYDYSINLGVNNNYHFNHDSLKTVNLEVKDLNDYIDDYTQKYGIPFASHNTVMKYFLLEMIKVRIEEVILSDSLVQTYHKYILFCISNLSNDFIRKNKQSIIRLLKKIDNQEYDGDFRKVICHIDQALYSNISNNR
jgi:hypothetical protein